MEGWLAGGDSREGGIDSREGGCDSREGGIDSREGGCDSREEAGDSAAANPWLYSPEEQSPAVYDLNRKRKLMQYELNNSGLPWPTHKIRDRSGVIRPEPLNSGILDKDDGLEAESENDSNSLTGGSDDKMMPEDDSYTEGLSARSFQQDQHATSGSMHEELENEVYGELEDGTIDDTMIYSNDTFLLASASWSLGQDARLGTRKPTIDQEFEQYFSALML